MIKSDAQTNENSFNPTQLCIHTLFKTMHEHTTECGNYYPEISCSRNLVHRSVERITPLNCVFLVWQTSSERQEINQTIAPIQIWISQKEVLIESDTNKIGATWKKILFPKNLWDWFTCCLPESSSIDKMKQN